ncbi:YEATS domain-containing protein 4 [Hydra vulgaris]|uniref:YEATS domain-containing protein 4 n=1 Tax=Hydra vulgaris TaxID=6087 RepID=T2MHN8_HYDVU|nr:YEATS domain-containing protein 4 [Hydra vulgaris]
MTEFSPVESARARGKTVVKQIVFGNESKYFGKKRENDGHTHSWTVYVKPFIETEDLSSFIKKVQFKLHESYTDALRTVTKPPYQVTETGWGEFEVIIKIYFIDAAERPVTLYHLLKLFSNPLLANQPHVGTQGQLVSEFYDEIIFHDPSIFLYKQLTTPKMSTAVRKHETDWKTKGNKTLASIKLAKKRVAEEIAQMNDRLKKRKVAIQKLKEEIQKIEKQNQKQ